MNKRILYPIVALLVGLAIATLLALSKPAMVPALVDGGSFESGDVLLRIDDADYKTALDRATAQVDRTDVEASFAKDELQRLQRLHDQKLASQSQKVFT